MYDVMVIGAGPTGCVAAKILAEKGTKFCLLRSVKCHVINPVRVS